MLLCSPVADRMLELRQPLGKSADDSGFERTKGRRPLARFGCSPLLQLRHKPQQPSEAYGLSNE